MAFSVVIPTFNRASLTLRALESVRRQSVAPVETIVVDDGSDVRNRETLARGAGGVRLHWQPNQGAGAARNAGLRLATSPWVAFLDSDDVWVPDHLARIANAIEATNGRAVLYFADTIRVDGRTTQWERSSFAVDGPFALVEDGAEWALGRQHPMMVQSSVVDREMAIAMGGFRDDLRRRQDTLFLLKLAIGRPICAVNARTVRMTDTSGAARLTEQMATSGLKYWQASTVVYRDLLAALPQAAPAVRDELQRRLVDAHIRSARLAAADHLVGPAAWHALRALHLSPSSFVRRLTAQVSRPAPAR